MAKMKEYLLDQYEKASVCLDCKSPIDWEGEGGILWAGDTFCESCDPLEPKEDDNA